MATTDRTRRCSYLRRPFRPYDFVSLLHGRYQFPGHRSRRPPRPNMPTRAMCKALGHMHRRVRYGRGPKWRFQRPKYWESGVARRVCATRLIACDALILVGRVACFRHDATAHTVMQLRNGEETVRSAPGAVAQQVSRASPLPPYDRCPPSDRGSANQ